MSGRKAGLLQCRRERKGLENREVTYEVYTRRGKGGEPIHRDSSLISHVLYCSLEYNYNLQFSIMFHVTTSHPHFSCKV